MPIRVKNFRTVKQFPSVNSEQRLWPDNPTPVSPNIHEPGSDICLGVVVQFATTGVLNGVYICLASDLTGLGGIWLVVYDVDTDTIIYQQDGGAPGSGGWNRFDFIEPVPVNNTNKYQIYYFYWGSSIRFSVDGNYFTSGVTNGDIYALSNDEVAAIPGWFGQGQYTYNTGTASISPRETFNNSNYWIDPIFTPT